MRFIFTICLFLSVSTIIAQTEQETRNIATLCKVWGFLKYYHPEVAKGKLDWDKEFMIRVKTASALKSKEETCKFYLDWIESLGEVKKCKKCDNAIPDSLKKNLDNEWLGDTAIFSIDLTKKLVFIEQNRNQRKNRYVAKTRWIGSASMKGEKIYKDSIFPSTNLRLLGLSRYWNFTNYFFPYKYQMDVNWEKTLTDMIPLFLYPTDTVIIRQYSN